MSARAWLKWLSLCFAIGCASAQAPTFRPRRPKPPVLVAQPSPPTAPIPTPAPVRPTVSVRGLTGTLNKDDVHQTMEARQAELDACIGEVRRRESFVHGSIQFAFAVGADGHVVEVHPTESDLGHFDLERCLSTVVAETQFPLPDGRATARFDWGLSVFGAYEPSEPLDPALLSRLLEKRSADIYKDCELRRFRNRFRVTLYVGRRGRVLSAGAIPSRPLEEEQLSCVLHAIRDWRMPKQKRRAKVTFVLR